jgi:hypothetical protein
MAGDWIKVQTCTPDKPEVHQLAESLGIDPDAVVGKLLRIWVWADQQTLDGNARSVTKSLLDRVTSVSGFADAMLNVGWLTKTEAGFAFPNFDRHNGQTAKKRATGAKRVENHRKTGSAKVSSECNALSVTAALPEKRREEKNSINGERPSENRIPDSLNDQECVAAADRWFKYLDVNGLELKNPKYNEPALEAWWCQMARLGREGFLLAVEQSMAAMRWNVELRDPPSGRGRKTESKEWIAAVKAAKAHPSDWEKRKQILEPDVFEALKLTGSKAVAFGNDFELKTLKELFDSHLKDVRNGIKTGN